MAKNHSMERERAIAGTFSVVQEHACWLRVKDREPLGKGILS